MPNAHYKVGYTLERDVKIALEQEGYTIFRSAGSHSKADLIGFKREYYPILVQCKRHKNLVSRKEMHELIDFAQNLNCDPVIAWRDKGIHWETLGK